MPTLDTFTRAYISTALWSTTGDDGEPLDTQYGVEDVAPESLQAMIKDCEQFQQENDLSEMGDSAAGHDFWLTRNGHGSGFWDGDWPENGEQLTAAAKKYGQADIYVGDDGYIYQSGSETSETQPPRDAYDPTSYDTELLKSMGVQASIKSPLLFKKSPKLAFDFSDEKRQYDYEANGNEVVLITPANVTKLLVDDEAQQFWSLLDAIEEEVLPDEERHTRVQEIIASFFREGKAARYVVRVNASSLKRAAVTFIAEAVEKQDRVEKFKFTSAQKNALHLDKASAWRLHSNLASFNLTGEVVKI